MKKEKKPRSPSKRKGRESSIEKPKPRVDPKNVRKSPPKPERELPGPDDTDKAKDNSKESTTKVASVSKERTSTATQRTQKSLGDSVMVNKNILSIREHSENLSYAGNPSVSYFLTRITSLCNLTVLTLLPSTLNPFFRSPKVPVWSWWAKMSKAKVPWRQARSDQATCKTSASKTAISNPCSFCPKISLLVSELTSW